MVSIQDLPDEIILKVINYLQIYDLLRCGRVSKRIRKISHDESLRKKAYGLVAENTELKRILVEALHDNKQLKERLAKYEKVC